MASIPTLENPSVSIGAPQSQAGLPSGQSQAGLPSGQSPAGLPSGPSPAGLPSGQSIVITGATMRPLEAELRAQFATRKTEDVEQEIVVPDEVKSQWQVWNQERTKRTQQLKIKKEQERQKRTEETQKRDVYVANYVAQCKLIQLKDYLLPCYGRSNVWTTYYYDSKTQEIVCISNYSTEIFSILSGDKLAGKMATRSTALSAARSTALSAAKIQYMNPPIGDKLDLRGNVSIYRFDFETSPEEWNKFYEQNPSIIPRLMNSFATRCSN